MSVFISNLTFLYDIIHFPVAQMCKIYTINIVPKYELKLALYKLKYLTIQSLIYTIHMLCAHMFM